jgi:putative flippase GtrA
VITRLRSLWSWSKTHQGKKLIRYTTVSASSTVISFLALTAFYGLKIIPSVIWSTLAGNLVASVPAYQLNRRWTWGKRGKSGFRREVAPFWAMTFVGIGVSLVGAVWARHEVRSHQWSHLANTALVSFTNLASFAIFWVLKLIVFNRIFHVETIEEIDEHLSAEESTPS